MAGVQDVREQERRRRQAAEEARRRERALRRQRLRLLMEADQEKPLEGEGTDPALVPSQHELEWVSTLRARQGQSRREPPAPADAESNAQADDLSASTEFTRQLATHPGLPPAAAPVSGPGAATSGSCHFESTKNVPASAPWALTSGSCSGSLAAREILFSDGQGSAAGSPGPQSGPLTPRTPRTPRSTSTFARASATAGSGVGPTGRVVPRTRSLEAATSIRRMLEEGYPEESVCRLAGTASNGVPPAAGPDAIPSLSRSSTMGAGDKPLHPRGALGGGVPAPPRTAPSGSMTGRQTGNSRALARHARPIQGIACCLGTKGFARTLSQQQSPPERKATPPLPKGRPAGRCQSPLASRGGELLASLARSHSPSPGRSPFPGGLQASGVSCSQGALISGLPGIKGAGRSPGRFRRPESSCPSKFQCQEMPRIRCPAPRSPLHIGASPTNRR